MSKKYFKKAPKVKSNVVQYLIIALICLPFLILFGLGADKWQLSRALTIFIMCCIILAVWICWLLIRSLYRKRAQRIMLERKQARKNK